MHAYQERTYPQRSVLAAVVAVIGALLLLTAGRAEGGGMG